MVLRALVAGVFLVFAPLTFAAAPPEGPPARLFTRVYSVADLVVPIGPARKQPPRTIEKKLIRLIESTIHPCSWVDVGGMGTIDYYPLGMALVVNQTPGVQEEVAELLAALRKLQDVEVTVETRLLSVPTEVVDRLGLDLSGGKTPGVAVLDDTQVHMLLEAMQGDRRVNVLQAPKITMFNGQHANVDLTEHQRYVIGIDWQQKDGKPVAVPQTKSVKSGLEVSLLPTVAPDRKNVTLQLGVNLATALPSGPPCCANAPRFHNVALAKTLKLADGATAMLTGWTQQREVRHEFSPPVLSKIPYVNRLFKNVGIGRETEHLIVLVTPRILVREEEEESIPAPRSEETAEQPGSRTEILPNPVSPPEEMYVNRKSFELSYELANLGPSKVRSLQVWVTRPGKAWEAYPEEVRPIGSVPISVKAEGRYGFFLVPRNGVGVCGDAPQERDQPHAWVVVDETTPQVELHTTYVQGTHPDGRVTFSWKASDDCALAAGPVSLYWADAPAGPWRKLADGLSDAGKYDCSQRELPYQFYVRVTAADRAGNVSEEVTPHPVRIDTKVPKVTNVKVKARD